MVSKSFKVMVLGYSPTKKADHGFDSRLFSVGGHTWCITYHSNGGVFSCFAGRISFTLVLCDRIDGPMNARCKFSLLDRAGRPVQSHARDSPVIDWSGNGFWCCPDLVTAEELEQQRPEFLGDDDCLVVRFDILFTDVLGAARESTLPPSDLHQHLGKLLSTEEGADVTFQLVADGGATFAAHRCMLAARSPVFRAQLFGPMKEGSKTTAGVIAIDDMEAEVFSFLLTFIYTDSLPDADANDDDGVMAQHLLTAADRYGLDRMKLICEEKLRKHIDGSSVGNILALADQHNCHDLTEACFEFLSSGANLEEFAGTDAFEQLISSSPCCCEGAGC